jgi:hypothetical protein
MKPPPLPQPRPKVAFRYVAWPYGGVVIVAVALSRIGPDPDRTLIALLGCMLVLPFVPVQYAILRRKIDMTTGILFGFIGPMATFLLVGALAGVALQR